MACAVREEQEFRQVKLINHTMTDIDEKFTHERFKHKIWDEYRAKFEDNQADLYVKLSDNKEMREPGNFMSGRNYDFLLLSSSQSAHGPPQTLSFSSFLASDTDDYQPPAPSVAGPVSVFVEGKLILHVFPSYSLMDVQSMLSNRGIGVGSSMMEICYLNGQLIWSGARPDQTTLSYFGIRGDSEITVTFEGCGLRRCSSEPTSCDPISSCGAVGGSGDEAVGSSNESESMLVHFQIGPRRKKIELHGREKLGSILEMLGFRDRNDIVDVRVKSKSLFKMIPVDENICESKSLLTDLGIHRGDILDVILNDMQKTCVNYRWNHMKFESSDLEYFKLENGQNNDDIKKDLMDLGEFRMPGTGQMDNVRIFECRKIQIGRELRHLMRPLYGIDRPPILKWAGRDNHDNADVIDRQGYLQLWPNCRCIDWPSKTDISSDTEWPWGEDNFQCWISGIIVSDKNETRPPRYLIRLDDESLIDAETRIHFKDYKTLKASNENMSIPRKDRKFIDFISLIQSKDRVLLPNNQPVRMFERFNCKGAPIEGVSEICDEILKCDDFWISCTRERTQVLIQSWR